MTREALPARRWALDLAASAALLAVPIAGLWPTFGGPSYLVAAVGATIVGLAIAAAGALWRWGVLVLTAVVAVAYFALGGALALPYLAIAGVVPDLGTLQALAVGAVTSWKQLLTTVAPVAASDGHLVVPFLMSLVAAVVVASVALRARRPAWALPVVLVFLAGQIALGTSEPAAPIAQGAGLAVVAIVWLAVRRAWDPRQAAVSLGGDGEEGRIRRGGSSRRLLAGAGVVAVAGLVGIAAGAAVPATSPRYVLRDVVIPPFDIREYASPLQGYRGYVRDDAQAPLFRVTGLPDGARVRLATMDAYSGTVYNVSDDGAGSSSAFTPVRGAMSPGAQGTPVTLRVEIDEFSGVWMPDAGAVASVEFDGERADDLRRAAHYNEATGTGVVTVGLQQGDAYTLETVLPTQPSDERLADAAFAPVKMPEQDGVPQELADIAAKAVAEATTPIEQARALESALADGGFFSHGLEGEALSRAGHGAARISALVGSDQMVGDDEQYAVAMALMAGQVGMPARVVMGFHPGEEGTPDGVFTATGDNLHAWVEIAFEGAGWIPFDPTPPEDKLPNDQTTKPRADPKPQVLQPPPPEQDPVDLPPTVSDDRESEDEKSTESGPLLAILAMGGGGLGVLALLAAPFVVIGAIKAARRRRRRAAGRGADRISGGWDELIDRATDLGTPVRPGATRLEDASVVDAEFAEPRVLTLAHRADAEVFGPAEPTEADVDEFWRQVDEIVAGMSTARSLWRRTRARLSLRSLRDTARGASARRRGRTDAARADASAGTEHA
ncbi:MFS family permease [Microbacterium ulmi]|nr:transglutaminase-like domain-containing protein [Microbacterium ulmi]NII69708.1 MFS family permease [Microbacterium ulmi]